MTSWTVPTISISKFEKAKNKNENVVHLVWFWFLFQANQLSNLNQEHRIDMSTEQLDTYLQLNDAYQRLRQRLDAGEAVSEGEIESMRQIVHGIQGIEDGVLGTAIVTERSLEGPQQHEASYPLNEDTQRTVAERPLEVRNIHQPVFQRDGSYDVVE